MPKLGGLGGLGGRGGRAENRLGPNYISNRALKKEEKWLDKVASNTQRQLSRDEARMKKSLERLRTVKSNTKSRIVLKGSTPVPSRMNSQASHYDRDNISYQPSHHKPSRLDFHDSHGPPRHNHDGQPSSRQMVHSKMKIDEHHRGHNEGLLSQRSGRMHHRTGQQPNQHDQAGVSKPVVPQLNIHHDSGHHLDEHDGSSGKPIKLTLPQIQNLNEAMAHVHAPMSTVIVDDHDHDDHVNSPGSHSRIVKPNASSMRNIYDEAIQKMSSFHERSPRFSENNSTSSIKSETRRQRKSVEKLPEIDKHAFRDLENIVKEAKSRKKEIGANNYASRHNRRRLQHLEQLLEELRPRVKSDAPFDPASILECRYLRLSKANVENLENMIREKGVDPGIHAHTDVSNYNIWD